jgi:hypothetical protein
MASVFVHRSPAPPRVWGMLMDYWHVPASLAAAWWRALGRSHHPRARAIRQAVFLFDAAPVAEAYHLVYGGVCPASRDGGSRGSGRRGAVATEPGHGNRGGGTTECRPGRRMAVSR